MHPLLSQPRYPVKSENGHLSYVYPENRALAAFVDAAAGEIAKKATQYFLNFAKKRSLIPR